MNMVCIENNLWRISKKSMNKHTAGKIVGNLAVSFTIYHCTVDHLLWSVNFLLIVVPCSNQKE